jgi:uncharacterized membrane protein
MADHIRNPIEWACDQIWLAALSVGSLGRSLEGSQESREASLPAVCRIKVADLGDVLVKGLDDFGAYRTDVIFLCLVYPLVGIALAWLTFGYEMLPLLFPLASGFALVGPVVAVGLYEMSRRHEQGVRITWVDAFGVIRSPGFGAILVLGLLLLTIFLFWLLVATVIYQLTLGPEPPASIATFARDVFTTSAGWTMIVVGVGVGFLFALLVLAISVVSFPLLLEPGRGAPRGGIDVDRRCGCEPRSDGRLGPDRRRGDRVNTSIPWSHRRRARARALHLAPVPQAGGAEHVAIRARQCQQLNRLWTENHSFGGAVSFCSARSGLRRAVSQYPDWVILRHKREVDPPVIRLRPCTERF